MKIRYALVAVLLASAAACTQTPTAPARRTADPVIHFDGSASGDSTVARGGGAIGSGS